VNTNVNEKSAGKLQLQKQEYQINCINKVFKLASSVIICTYTVSMQCNNLSFALKLLVFILNKK